MKNRTDYLIGALTDNLNEENVAAATTFSGKTIPLPATENIPDFTEQSSYQNIQVNSTLPTGTLDSIIDSSGNPLTDGATTRDATPVFSGTADPGDRIEISVYGPYDVLYAHHYTMTVGYDGKWAFSPSIFNVLGVYEIHVSVEDANGKNGHYLGTLNLNYFDPALIHVSVDSIEDQNNQGYNDFTGTLANNQTTNDARPELHGSVTSTSEMAIHIYDNGQLLGTVTAGYSSTWSFRPDEPLSDGPHHFYVTAENAGTTWAQSDEFAIIIDTTPPTGELVSVVGQDGDVIPSTSTTSETRPAFSGTAESDSIVHINVIGPGGKALYTTDILIDNSGEWTWQAKTFTDTGTYTFNIDISDAAGNVSHLESYTLDYYDASQIHLSLESVTDNVHQSANDFAGDLLNGMSTNDNLPVLQGKANAGFIVNVYDNGHLLSSTTADANGIWNFRILEPLSDGIHEITATELTPEGETAPTDSFTINVMTAPPAGDLLAITDHLGNLIASGDRTADKSPILSGNATVGSTVNIHAYDPLGHSMYTASVQADALGHWQYQAQQFPNYGKYTFTIAIIDGIGNVDRPDTQYVVQYDSGSPLHYSIDYALSDNYSSAKTIHEGGITHALTPEICGTASSGLVINLYDNGHLLGSTTADSSGRWVYSMNTWNNAPLTEGVHAITITALLPAGESAPVAPFHFIVDRTLPEGSITNITTLDGGIITPYTNTTQAETVIHGRADPHSEVHVKVYENGKILYSGEVMTDDSGHWSYQPQAFTEFAHYSFSISLVGENGMVNTPESNYPITYSDPALFTLSLDSVTDNVSYDVPQYDGTGPLTEGAYTNDPSPVLQGKTNPGVIVNIYDNGHLLGSVQATEDGHWSLSHYTNLVDGSHSLTLTEITPTGESQPTPAFHFTVETTTAWGQIHALNDEQGNPIAQGDVTADHSPVVSGYADPNAEVHIHLLLNDHQLYWEGVKADSSGHWSWQPDALTEDGTYSLTIAVIGQGGNITRYAESWSFELHSHDGLSSDSLLASAPTESLSGHDDLFSQQVVSDSPVQSTDLATHISADQHLIQTDELYHVV